MDIDIISQIRMATRQVLADLFSYQQEAGQITVAETKPEFEGDYTVVLFSFVKQLKKSPEDLGNLLGKALVDGNPQLFTRYNVIKGFLNLTIADSRWLAFLGEQYANEQFGRKT